MLIRWHTVTHVHSQYCYTLTDFTEGPTSGETPTISLANNPAVTSTEATASLAGDNDVESQTGEDPLTQGVPTETLTPDAGRPTPDAGREDSDLITTTPKESTLTPPTLAMPPDHPLESELCLPPLSLSLSHSLTLSRSLPAHALYIHHI